MSTSHSSTTGAAFSRKRIGRTAASLASAGLMVGISFAAASPAMAATDADCVGGLGGNIVDATMGGTAANIQNLLDGSEPIICLSGTFVLAVPLTYNYDVTIHGLTDAVLDGDGVTGILSDDGSHSITVENMRFTNGNASDGGAIAGYVATVYNSQFDNNFAFTGGAISAYNADIYDSLFFDNEADAVGGAVAVQQYVEVTDSTFRTNAAQFGGAVMSYSVAISYASTFEGNTADIAGGAIMSFDAVNVSNSTFVNNQSDAVSGYGGAVASSSGSVFQSTFLNNSAAYGQSMAATDGTIYLRGNIFAGPGAQPQLATEGGTLEDVGANLFTTTQAAETALSSVQPTSIFSLTTLALFDGATLADNGGPTQTVALYGASPALSAVPADPDSMTEDQRGVARPAVSDAGAYEYDGPVAVLAATGSEPTGWIAGAAALLLAGAAALGLSRRNRRAL